MKILHVSSARAPGGGERHLADLARGLARRGHEVYAALREDSPLRAELLASLPPRNVFTLPLTGALDLLSAHKLARLARDHEIDIIHAHLARDYPPAALAARRAPRTRLVITRHVLFPMNRAQRLALSNAARVIAVSGGVARSLRARHIFPEHKIRVVPNAIDFARVEADLGGFERDAYRAETLRSRAPLLVGTVGELSEVKGQDDFVRAASLVARGRGGAVEFLVVGEDHSRGGENRARLEALIDELGLGGRVRLLGRTEELARLLSSLDVFVSASRSEAFGLAMVEAMACGCAVVSTATEGAREILEDGATGVVVPVGDPPALAAAVESLLDDAPRRNSLAARAREAARSRFDLARMVEATERVYEEAVSS
ncbi:MAG TPA: glycosyltransferase family 4 protein [Pyrinomonadaceae bacterium]|nr:glycosyltransferase family 4 protein [Pyrinomonadaceae bacterium]